MTVVLRGATPLDAGAVGAVLHRFNTDTPWMPDLHTGAETISFCGTMIDRGWVTVACDAGQVVGFLARDGAEVCSLYLRAEAQGKGIGKTLLDHAKAHSPILELWAFVQNEGACRFYTREGFEEVDRTDGATNEERLPDIRFRWQKEQGK